MAGCITSDYQAILINLIEQEAKKETLKIIIDAIPLCEERRAVPPMMAASRIFQEAARQVAREPPWGIQPVYYDESGKETTYSSPSALVKALGLPMSGIQCDIEGKKCRAQSVVEILRIHGYTVSGDGEPKKAFAGGTKLTVYHPQAPQLIKGG